MQQHRARSTQNTTLFQYAMILPLILVIGLVLFYPIAYSFWVSLHDYQLTRPNDITYIGFENYAALSTGASFTNAMLNTVVFVFNAVLIEFLLGLLLAQLLWRQKRWAGVFRSVLLSPMFITPIAVGLIFRFMLNSQLGIIPYLLQQVNIEIDFFGTNLAMLTIIMIDVWQWTPFMMLLLLAGMEALDVEPFEAAKIDGADTWATLRYLTLPMLRPVIMAAVIIRGLDAFKVFEYVWAITRGGPGERTETIMFHIYQTGFRFFQMGQAAAMGYILVIVIIIIAFIVYWLLTRDTHRQIERTQSMQKGQSERLKTNEVKL